MYLFFLSWDKLLCLYHNSLCSLCQRCFALKGEPLRNAGILLALCTKDSVPSPATTLFCETSNMKSKEERKGSTRFYRNVPNISASRSQWIKNQHNRYNVVLFSFLCIPKETLRGNRSSILKGTGILPTPQSILPTSLPTLLSRLQIYLSTTPRPYPGGWNRWRGH